jgi:20S proteasome subunit alpha 6
VATHFQDANNVLEVLLRLIRGGAGSTTAERAQHGSQSASLALQASASGAPYPDQQTPISLAAFQLFKMGLDAAIEAGVPKAEVEKRIGEIIRDLPYSLIFRSLDSMFPDFKKSTKR